MHNKLCYTAIAEVYILEKLLVPLPTDVCFVKEIKKTISDKLQSWYILRSYQISLMYLPVLIPNFSVINRHKTIEQIKSEALEVTDTIADMFDHCELKFFNYISYKR